MDAGDMIRIDKPSFWSGTRMFYNAHGGLIGTFKMTSVLSFRKGEGAVSGKTLSFAFSGVSAQESFLRDEWGHRVGTMSRPGWLGRDASLMLYEKGYVWRTNNWGTEMWIEESNGTPLITVTGCGGFGVHGNARFSEALPTEEALALSFAALFQMRLFEMQVALTTLVLAGAVAIFFS